MNRVLRIDEESLKCISRFRAIRSLSALQKRNPEVAVLVKQALLSAYAMPPEIERLAEGSCIQKI